MASTGSHNFGAWLRSKLGKRSYGQVAEYVGVSTSTVSRWITGASGPEYRNRLRLAEYLGVELDELEALLPPEPALMYRSGGAGAIMGAPADPAGRAVPTVYYYAPDGAVRGRSGLDAREQAAVDLLLARIDAYRDGRGVLEDVGGGDPGPGGPR
jgi:transcriptional regulator with XRE-family HTH domain